LHWAVHQHTAAELIAERAIADTWFDQRSNIIFTCSKGFNGVCIDRPEW
jgi:hypothetical protein